MPRSTAEELTIESRRCRVAELFLRGIKRQGELAERLGVDRSTVSRDLKVLNARWKEAGVRDLDAAKGRELDRIDLLEREAWEAWERSKSGQETTTTEQTTTPQGERSKAAFRKEEQHGDPRYLDHVEWWIEQRCRILGLHAPQKIAPTDPTGNKPYEPSLTDDQRAAAIVAILARVGPGSPRPDLAGQTGGDRSVLGRPDEDHGGREGAAGPLAGASAADSAEPDVAPLFETGR
jgi:hypothetical protein